MDLLFAMGAAAVIAAVKDPKKKAQIRSAAFKVFKTLVQSYGRDPDFIDYVKDNMDVADSK